MAERKSDISLDVGEAFLRDACLRGVKASEI